MDFKRYDGETEEQLLYRIGQMKDELGYSWQEVADIMNNLLDYDYSESKYRKQFCAFKKMLEANEDIFSNDSTYKQELDSLKHDIKLSSVIFGRTSFHRRKKGHVTKAVYGRFPLCTEEYTESEWAMGFLFCVRKELMDRWEIRFDETLRYYAYAEDLDFSYRYYKCAHKENLRCLISSLLHVKHNVSTEYRTPARRHVFMHSVQRWYLSKKLFNCFISQLMVFWADMGYMAFRFVRKEQVRDNWDALIFCIKHRKDIINGNLHYLDYMQ